MHNIARPLTLIAVLVLFAAAGAVACSDDDDPQTAVTPGASASAAARATAAPVSYAPAGAATFPVIAGSTDGNIDVEAFMPADIRVRVSDTIQWTGHGYEGHTVTFGQGDDTLAGIGPYLLPDPANAAQMIFNPKLSLKSEKQGTHDGDTTYINSGFFGVPVEQTFDLTFTKAGLYTYLCLVHPFTMTGTVSVDAADAQVVSPASVQAQGEAEVQRYSDELRAEADRLAAEAVSAPGPDGATIHYVAVGGITDHGQIALYTPGKVDARVGDTVIFHNDDRNFHNVIFKGSRPELPPGIGIIVDPEGRGLNFSLDAASAVAVDPPAAGFDDTTFLSSGSMGVTQPRLTWTLRFDKAGTYVYTCTIHTLAGMTGVIEVQ